MAFEQEKTRTPTSIGAIVITLSDADGTGGHASSGISVDIQDQDGALIRQWRGSLQEHLSPGEIQAVWNFLVAIRQKAVAGFLP